ncbi:hypothetical protein K8I31_01765, partial [bacterium]|nr:hypothetical protein [bacterium]
MRIIHCLILITLSVTHFEAPVWAQTATQPAVAQPAAATQTATITIEQIDQRRTELTTQRESIQNNINTLNAAVQEAQKQLDAVQAQVDAAQAKAGADGKIAVELTEQFAKAKEALSAARSKAPAELMDRLQQQIQLLERISLLYDQQQGALDQAKSLRST